MLSGIERSEAGRYSIHDGASDGKFSALARNAVSAHRPEPPLTPDPLTPPPPAGDPPVVPPDPLHPPSPPVQDPPSTLPEKPRLLRS